MTEIIIVILIVGAVIALSIQSIYKTLTGQNTSCGCSGCSSSCSGCKDILSDKTGNSPS